MSRMVNTSTVGDARLGKGPQHPAMVPLLVIEDPLTRKRPSGLGSLGERDPFSPPFGFLPVLTDLREHVSPADCGSGLESAWHSRPEGRPLAIGVIPQRPGQWIHRSERCCDLMVGS